MSTPDADDARQSEMSSRGTTESKVLRTGVCRFRRLPTIDQCGSASAARSEPPREHHQMQPDREAGERPPSVRSQTPTNEGHQRSAPTDDRPTQRRVWRLMVRVADVTRCCVESIDRHRCRGERSDRQDHPPGERPLGRGNADMAVGARCHPRPLPVPSPSSNHEAPRPQISPERSFAGRAAADLRHQRWLTARRCRAPAAPRDQGSGQTRWCTRRRQWC